MSIGGSAIGEKAVASQLAAQSAVTRPSPARRTTVAVADQVQQPEVR